MAYIFKYFLIYTIFTLVVGPFATAQINLQPAQIAESSMKFLAGKKHISTSWFVTYDSAKNANNLVTTAWNGNSHLSRDLGYYALSERLGESTEYFYDGEIFTIRNVIGQKYAQRQKTGSFDQLVTSLSMDQKITLPVWELFSSETSGDLTSGLIKAQYIGMTQVMGETAHHLKLAKPDRKWEMWVSANESRPVPLMIIGQTTQNGGSHYQAMFYDWNFQPTAKKNRFVFKPHLKDFKTDWDSFNYQSVPDDKLDGN